MTTRIIKFEDLEKEISRLDDYKKSGTPKPRGIKDMTCQTRDTIIITAAFTVSICIITGATLHYWGLI